MPKVGKAKGRKKAPRRVKAPADLYTSQELAKKYGLTADAVRKKMSRHGFRATVDRKYRESDFLKAHKAGLEADKARAAQKMAAAGDDDTLQAVLLRSRSRLLDIQIQKSQAELDQLLGRVVSLDEHRETVLKVQRLMISWFDQAAENAATKIKNAEVLRQLREARDRACREILEIS